MTRRPSPVADWNAVSAASLPIAGLGALAPLRNRADVRVTFAGERAWICWPEGRADVVPILRPVTGAMFFVRRGTEWFRFGSRLPTSACPPDDEGQLVANLLFPSRVEPLHSDAKSLPPVMLGIIRGGEPKTASALGCSLANLAGWADRATVGELASVRAARSEDRAVLLGTRLPSIPTAIRFWGESVLVPLGHRPEPDLPPEALREAVGASREEIVLLHADRVEIIPRAAFEPLTRAGVRLALRDGALREVAS